MARWIKVDGTEQEVHPTNGYKFADRELDSMVEGCSVNYTLISRNRGGLYMFINVESSAKTEAVNQVATDLLHMHRVNFAHVKVYGDVVVAGIDETGDE